MWKDKYCKLLNSSIVDSHRVDVLSYIKNSSHCNDLTTLYKVDLIKQLLAKLPLNKATGPDQLTAEHLHFCETTVSAYISIFFNLCIKQGYFPKKCMDTVLVPIVKNTNAMINDPNNYRPIAVATVMSKLLEHVIVTWCRAALKTNDNQFGFKLNASSDM